MNGLKVLLYQMSQIRYTKCSKYQDNKIFYI